MSCLIRRTALDDAGGLKAFGGYLAEDYFIAEQVQKMVRSENGLPSNSSCVHSPEIEALGVVLIRCSQYHRVELSTEFWSQLRIMLPKSCS